MKKWNDREYNIVEWVITYISEMSVDEKHRAGIRRLKEKPVLQHMYYSEEEKEALAAAITYFEEMYSYSVKGCLKGSKTVKGVLLRLTYLRGARDKLCADTKQPS